MPRLKIKLDVDRHGFDALRDIANDRVIRLGEAASIEVGTVRRAGQDSVVACFALPDGRVVLAETSAAMFIAAARTLTSTIISWQDTRRERGKP